MGLDDAALAVTIEKQRELVAASERAFVQARERFDRGRRRLRALEDERERRRLIAAGIEAAPAPVEKVRRKRSTTGTDALLGRDGIDPDRTFDHFHLRSLQRQEIVLSGTGDRQRQVLRFVDPASGAMHEAHTFGEARRYYEQGFAQGRPGDPLQRQEIWYVADNRPGRLRLDQLFVEPDVEEA
ncbi:MAG TPA: hypothetical protein VHB98_21045 [Chloroflexota bacterium]|jgi:hypothetical protein|nr:hypothetical protein [Chloroflexota bacterium]